MGTSYYGVIWESKKGFKVVMFLGDNLDYDDRIYEKLADNLLWLIFDDEARDIVVRLEEEDNVCSPRTMTYLLSIYRKIKDIPEFNYRGRLILYLALMKLLNRKPQIISEYDLENGKYVEV